MQTYAEKSLIEALISELRNRPGSLILNIGSSGSVVVEDAMAKAGCNFIADHLDIDVRETHHARVGRNIVESAEAMTSLSHESYDACFSNFVWEHIKNVDAATREAWRVMKDGSLFAFTVPNPLAPEFLLIRLIPLSLRGRIKGYEVWPTFYAYGSIPSLRKLCRNVGFSNVQVQMYPAVYTYAYRFPVLSTIAKVYDTLLGVLGLRALMGHALILCRK